MCCYRRQLGHHRSCLERYVPSRVSPAGLVGTACLFFVSLSTLPRDALAWWPWDTTPIPEEPLPLNVSVLYGVDSGQEWLDGSVSIGGAADRADRRSRATPPPWDSGECMASWGLPELQREVDPRGYVVFSEGREQLGNNRFLLSDGLVIAKALDRTLVEFPMEHSRIATADAELGLCDYWDCTSLCSYHRILDLWTFRSMLRDGLIPVEGFVTVLSASMEQTLLPGLVTAENITDFFGEYDQWQVVVMKMAWKSGLRREPVDLLRPNLFYEEIAESLTSRQKGWEDGAFMAVQWRTETSTGNLTECYERYVRPTVEAHRSLLGFEPHHVFFNTDLVGQASTTYNASVVEANQGVVRLIRGDYPAGMANTVYDCLEAEQDAGVKAMISGLVSASAGFLLSSSFNGSGDNQCQKPHSKYIDLIAEWRLELLWRDPQSIGELFPAVDGDENVEGALYGATMVVVFGVLLFGGIAMLGTKMDLIERAKGLKSM